MVIDLKGEPVKQPRYKMVDGKRVRCTPQEEEEFDRMGAVWEAGKRLREAHQEIAKLEAKVTQRRLREAVLTGMGKDWLAKIERRIHVQRLIIREYNDR